MARVGTEKFFSDLKVVIESAEQLLHSTAEDAGEQVKQAHEKARDKLRAAREHLSEMQVHLLTEARAKAKAADGYVHENPWRSIGLAAGLAFALGVLMGRRR